MLFSSPLLCYKKKNNNNKNYFMVFHVLFKKQFRTWTTKLSLAVFYKIKKLSIIEIIFLNVTHLFLIFLYCLFIYIYIYIFFPINSKQWIIWFFNIFWFFRNFNIWIFELFFAVSETVWQIFVSHCTFKQWLLHQIATQIEVIQEQIM